MPFLYRSLSQKSPKISALLRKEICNLAKQINNTGVTQYQDNQIWGQGWSFVAAGRYFPSTFLRIKWALFYMSKEPFFTYRKSLIYKKDYFCTLWQGLQPSVAVCCSVLKCVEVCGSVWQCAAVWCSVMQCDAVCCSVLYCVALCYRVLQCVAVCCSHYDR